MGALGRIGRWRHAVVAASAIGCGVLAATGLIGDDREERFDAKQITVSPAGRNGVHVREVVDQDFGRFRRHGYERVIPHDFGVPTGIVASSPDAPDQVSVTPQGGSTRIRIGDPDTTIDGQHRYVLEYTLPDAHLAEGRLALDIIDAGEELRTDRFEVVVTGFRLEETTCNVGSRGAAGGCQLTALGDDLHVVFEPLRAGDGVTIGGRIRELTTPRRPDLPELPPRRTSPRGLLALAMLPVGAAGGAGVYAIARRRGRNEVYGTGPADAAFGDLPAPGALRSPGATGAATTGEPSTRLVADADLAAMATIEFVPPKGVTPWQGAVLLTERIDDATVSAWFAGLVAEQAIDMTRGDGKQVVLTSGPKRAALDPISARHLDAVMAGRESITLGTYDPAFTARWQLIRGEQVAFIRRSGWWRRLPPGGSISGGGAGLAVGLIVAALVFGAGSIIGTVLGLAHTWPVALVLGLLVPAAVAWCVYRALLPSRSALGSALALRTESFRRFLDASEAQHVEWAWNQGLLREYSAWAVALGEADAWSRALAQANVPPAAQAYAAPLIVHSMGSSIAASHTRPPSSGGGSGSSGFSGGSVGGGGGGGSSGSW